MKRPQIKIKLVDRLGKCGCHHGHKVGDVFDYDTQRGELVRWQPMLRFLMLKFCVMEGQFRSARQEISALLPGCRCHQCFFTGSGEAR